MDALVVADLEKRFGTIQALGGLSFEVGKGELFCIVGPTNAGKSTLLKTIAGLYRPDAGRIVIGGQDASLLRPAARKVSLLFQNVALFPMLTGFENIAFPLRQAGASAEVVKDRVGALARTLDVEHILHRFPRTYSGGEQQRAAIGRALAYPGNLLMLDEPLTNLDAQLRIALRLEFKKLHWQTGQTILYVTHDQAEAMSLSDRIGVLHHGRFEQISTPDEIYHRPANRFVASFIGSPPMNIVEAELTQSAGIYQLAGEGFRVSLPAGWSPLPANVPREIAVGIRPEGIHVGPLPSPDTPIPADVTWIERLGNKLIMTIRVGTNLVKALTSVDHPVQREGPAWIGFIPQPHHFVDRDTGAFFS